jgi:hypothetical protein
MKRTKNNPVFTESKNDIYGLVVKIDVVHIQLQQILIHSIGTKQYFLERPEKYLVHFCYIYIYFTSCDFFVMNIDKVLYPCIQLTREYLAFVNIYATVL